MCNRELADCVRSSPEQSGEPPLREAPAVCSPVRKVNDEFGLALLRDCLGDPLGGFSGGGMAELVANVAAPDPVVEALVRKNMNRGCCHQLTSPSNGWHRIGDGALTGINCFAPARKPGESDSRQWEFGPFAAPSRRGIRSHDRRGRIKQEEH